MSSDAQKVITVSYEAFNRNPDGSWSSIKNTDIQTSDRSIRIPRGMVFFKDRPMWGIDVVKMLDEKHQQQDTK
jgi:hypothetical protein